MKKSRRLIRNTILALNGIMVLYVGVSRLYAVDGSTHTPERTSASELAKLRDFTAIEVQGDFGVEVVQAAEYSVGFTPPAARRGNFVASVRGNTLVLQGFGNAPANRVQVGMPQLTQLVAGEIPALTVSGFNGPDLSVRVDRVAHVSLRSNGIRHWSIFASSIGDLQIDKASMSVGKVDLHGHATLTVID